MAVNAEELYQRLGRLLENVPDFSGYQPLTGDQLLWLGRAEALVKEANDLAAIVDISTTAKKMLHGVTRPDALRAIMLILHSQMASLELKAPANARGTFIPVSNTFDAFAAIAKLFTAAAQDILVVDPYLDETVLTEFGTVIPSGVSLRLLSDAGTVKPSLAPAAVRWVSQHGTTHPLAVRLAPPRALHDRVVFIDRAGVWTLTQSLKDFAKRAPAEIIRADDTASLKLAAYENIWSSAAVIT